MLGIECDINLPVSLWQLANVLWNEQAGVHLGRQIDECFRVAKKNFLLTSGVVGVRDGVCQYSGAIIASETISPGDPPLDIDRVIVFLRKSKLYLEPLLKAFLTKRLLALAANQDGRLFINDRSIRTDDINVCVSHGIEGLLSHYLNTADHGQHETRQPYHSWCILVRCETSDALECICEQPGVFLPTRPEVRRKLQQRLKLKIKAKVMSLQAACELFHECAATSHLDTPEYTLSEMTTWTWLKCHHPELTSGRDGDCGLIEWILQQAIPFRNHRKKIYPDSEEWGFIQSCIPKAFASASRLEYLILSEITRSSMREILEICGCQPSDFSVREEPAAVEELKKIISTESPPTVLQVAQRIKKSVGALLKARKADENSKSPFTRNSEDRRFCPYCSAEWDSDDVEYCPECTHRCDRD